MRLCSRSGRTAAVTLEGCSTVTAGSGDSLSVIHAPFSQPRGLGLAGRGTACHRARAQSARSAPFLSDVSAQVVRRTVNAAFSPAHYQNSSLAPQSRGRNDIERLRQRYDNKPPRGRSGRPTLEATLRERFDGAARDMHCRERRRDWTRRGFDHRPRDMIRHEQLWPASTKRDHALRCISGVRLAHRHSATDLPAPRSSWC